MPILDKAKTEEGKKRLAAVMANPNYTTNGRVHLAHEEGLVHVPVEKYQGLRPTYDGALQAATMESLREIDEFLSL